MADQLTGGVVAARCAERAFGWGTCTEGATSGMPRRPTGGASRSAGAVGRSDRVRIRGGLGYFVRGVHVPLPPGGCRRATRVLWVSGQVVDGLVDRGRNGRQACNEEFTMNARFLSAIFCAEERLVW